MARPLADVLAPLTDKQRIYVSCLLKGMSKRASAAATGSTDPGQTFKDFDESPRVQAALQEARSGFAEEVEFSRREAHEMLMQAYRNADTAGEQIQAVRELVKLHGIAAPERHEHIHKHEGQIAIGHMTDDELLKLAELEDGFTLEGEYEEVFKDEDVSRALPAVV